MLNEFQEIIYEIESDDSIEILKEFPIPKKTIEIRNQQIKQSDIKVLSDQDIKLIQQQKLIEQQQQIIQQQIQQETLDSNQQQVQENQQQDPNQIETQQEVVAEKPEANPGSFFMIYGRKKFGTLQRMTQRVSEEEFQLFEPNKNKQLLEQDDDVIFEKATNNAQNQNQEQDPKAKAKIKNEKFQKLLQTHMAGQQEFIDVIMNMDTLDSNIQPQSINLKPTLKKQGKNSKNDKPKGKRNVQFGQDLEAQVQLPPNIVVKNYSATPQSLLAPVQLEQENYLSQNQQPQPKQMSFQIQQQQYLQNQKELQQQLYIDSINQQQEMLQKQQVFLQQQQQEQQKPRFFQPPYVNPHLMKPLPHISQLPQQDNSQRMAENRYKNNSFICQVRRETTPPKFRDIVTQQFQSTYQQQAEKPFIPDRKQPLFQEQERIAQQNMEEHIKKQNEKELLKSKKMHPPTQNIHQEPEKLKKIENENPIKSYQAERFKQEQLKTINEPPQIKQKADIQQQRSADYKEVGSLRTVKDALDNMVHIKNYIQQKQLDWTMKEFVEVHQFLMVCEPTDELSDKMRMLLTQLDKIINVDMVLIDSQEAQEEEQEKSQQYVLPSNVRASKESWKTINEKIHISSRMSIIQIFQQLKMETEETNIITYGSIICINHIEDGDALIGGDGFMKNSVILKGMSPLNKVDNPNSIESIRYLNIQNCLFMVCPTWTNALKLQAQNLIPEERPQQIIIDDETDYDRRSVKSQSLAPTQVKSSAGAPREKAIRDAIKKMLKEYKYNIEVFDKEKNQKVMYDQQIQFLHIASSKWLCAKEEEAKFEKQNFRLYLSEYTSDDTLFKIVPAFKYQKEGDQIIYSSEIVRITRSLPIQGKPTYLHCSGEKIDVKRTQIEINYQKNKINKREINSSNEEATQWKINLYSEKQQESSGSGDLVWIHHSETSSTLGIDFNEQKLAVNKINAAELSFDNYSGNSYGMWIIERVSYKQGGPFQFNQKYRFKHFSTNLYLAIVKAMKKEKGGNQTNIQTYQYQLQSVPDDNSVFELESLKQDNKGEKKTEVGVEFVYIRNIKNKKYLDIRNNQDHKKEIIIGQELEPIILVQKNENAVFKLFKANDSETREVFFLDSCQRTLQKYLHFIQIQLDSMDVDLYKIQLSKLKTGFKCISTLDEFIQSKIYVTRPSQKYGQISAQRQRLLKEQYFIDQLISILTKTVTKKDFFIWSHQKKILKADLEELIKNEQNRKNQKLTDAEMSLIIVYKVDLCSHIFNLLQSACQNNLTNQLYLFERLPQYQHFCKYLPSAVTFLIDIVRYNERILLNLSNGLNIQFDYEKKQEIVDDVDKKVKILINFYESGDQEDDKFKIPFKVHDRLIVKPINILQYFFNLLWDHEAYNKEYYTRFLRSICRFKSSGLSMNQENLFKLYKKFNVEGQLLFKLDYLSNPIPPAQSMEIDRRYQIQQMKELELTREQLFFFAEASFARNFLWKEELESSFKSQILFDNVWKQAQKYDDRLRPLWCKLGSALYVDQQPYNNVAYPIYCRLFDTCDKPKKVRREEFDILAISDIIQYLKEKYKEIKKASMLYEKNSYPFNLNDELIFATTELIQTLLSLNILSPEQYPKLIKYYLNMIMFDRKNLQYINAAKVSYRKSIATRLEKKKNPTNLGFSAGLSMGLNAFSAIASLGQQDKVEETEGKQPKKDDQSLFDQPELFNNPIMRGYMTQSYKLEKMISLPQSTMEIEIKLKICSIIDYILDQRQNFLISNILFWFKQYYQTIKSNQSTVQSWFLNTELVKEKYIPQLLPKIAQTGLEEIDNPPKQEVNLMQFDLLKEKLTFVNFFDQKVDIEEIHDLDFYFTQACKKITTVVKDDRDFKGSVFPYLLSTFYLVSDQVLEERCLNVMMRVFNQKEELKENLKKVQFIFDDDKSQMYEFVENKINDLRSRTEQSEIWLAKFKNKGDSIQSNTDLIKLLSLCMLQGSVIKGDQVMIQGQLDVNAAVCDTKKQSIINFLRVHEQVILLVKNGMGHMIEVFMSYKHSDEQKLEIFQLFKECMNFLILFCRQNRTNQLILYQDIETIILYLQYDVGQIQLLIEMFRDNLKLLNTGYLQLTQTILSLIEKEGRQSKYLQVLINLISCDQQESYILENQMQILNLLMPNREYKEQELRILYCEGSNDKAIKFYLDDQFMNESQDLYTQLKSVDWKDTYRDEPFIYHAQLLDFLIQTCLLEPSIRQYDPQFRDIDLKDNFNISVFKIKKIIRAQYLLELLREPDQQVDVKMRQLQFTRIISFQQSVQQETNFDTSKGFNILKPKILEFLRLIHITSEKAPAADIPLGQLTRDVIHVIDFEIRKLVAVQNKANFTDDYFDYIVEYLLPFLLSYTERVLTSQNLEIKRSIENFSKEFAKTLEEFKSMLTDRHVDIIQQFRSKYPNDEYHISFQDVKKDTIVNNDQDQEIQLQSHQELDDRQPLLIKQKTKKKKTGDQVIDMSERQSLENLWDQFTNYFQKCQTVLDEIETERSTLANALTKIDQLITEPCEIKHSSDTILKKLINFVQSGILQPQNSGTIVILLKIMGKIIEKDPAQLKEQQNLFDNLGATQMVLNVLSDYSKTLGTNMILNLMKFLNVLLCQGNTKVQEAVYVFCKTQQKSENIFKVFADYLRSATIQGEVDEEDQDTMMQKELVNIILKFLQNCAEGHYSELQNYIRYQSNSRASIDLINVVADLFKSQEKTIQSFSNLMRCLDTLNELVQGPCLENQVAVSDSKFFDVVQEMFPQRKKTGNEDRTQERRITKKKSTKKTDSKKKKKLPLTKGMKVQLQNKILILILSLMEKREINSKNMILRRIMRSLPINTLEIHISKVYKKFSSLYQGNYIMESFENINLDAEEDDDEDHPKMVNNEKQYSKKETVIQNGFYLMFLICYYIESGEAIDSQLINYNKQYLKQQNKENNLFDPNSTIGQLYSLLLEIIEQSLEMSNKLLALKELAGLSNEEVIQQKAIQKANDKKRIVKKAFMFFRSKTAHVELIRDDQIELVFFPVLPYCRLQKEEKIDFQNNVDRSSVKAKVQDLMDRSSEFIEKMIHEENMRLIYQKYKLIGFFANYVQLWKDLAYYLTIILNLIVIASYSHQTSDGNQLTDVQFFRDESYTVDQTKDIFFILGLVMTICSLFVVVFVLAKLAPLIVVKAYKKPDFFTGDVGLIKKLINLLYKPIFILLSCLADFTVLYYLGYGVLAILGTIVHPFFFCFHLSVVFLRFPTLRNVVRSVTEPRVSLLLTLLLIIIITYIYSLWAFVGLQKDYEQNCKSVLYCFLLIFEYNFQVPGGIGGQMTQNAPSPQYEPQRFIFDQTNNIILVIIMISIASGIIIDTFGQLREEENAMQSDINEKCFICGLENIRFERSSEGSGGFVGHIRLNHYMWNYLYYIAYLQSKSDQDYSGIESYVQKKRKEQDLSWVPFNRARELKKEDDDVEKEQKQVESISAQFDQMIEGAKQLQIQLKLFKQRRAQSGHKREDTNTQLNTNTQPTILDK